MTDMRHMGYLIAVARSDVEGIQQKEAVYQGSWKAGGGRSAWENVRRKMDRLFNMMRPPAVPEGSLQSWELMKIGNLPSRGDKWSERDKTVLAHVLDTYILSDVFRMIETNPGGADGTVLAEVRDLRRYLLLVEAEMVSRGVVVLPPAPAVPRERCSEVDELRNLIANMTPEESVDFLKEVGVLEADGQLHPDYETTEEAPPVAEAPAAPLPPAEGERLVPRHAPATEPANLPPGPGTPEDGGHHAPRERLEDGIPYVLGSGYPQDYRWTRDPVSADRFLIVARDRLPEDLWRHLPILRLQLNHVEWMESQPEYRGMYNLAHGGYELRPEYHEHWLEQE